ncbi:unnamed protein product [Nippostrongylus brasiliensis]|uniref:MFS domain-containing protein n=1 Tax=Nippostrongylus brasiliensis TaxID=27835 RepID=A0A0N4YF65_NIPBR|nr:unnamed protein product [Nippostrongylus brasiliensis]
MSIRKEDDDSSVNNALLSKDNSPQVESTQHDEDDNHCVYENLDPDKLVDAYGFGRYQIFGYFLTEVMNFFYSAALVIDPPYSTTLLKEFDISCSSFVWKEAGLTAFTVGAVLLVPIMSTLADEYGRRPLAVLCLCLAWNNTVVDLDRCRRSGIVVEEKREPLSAMLKSPALLKLLFINGFVQFSMAFYYFGISFLSVDLSEDRFTAYMLSAWTSRNTSNAICWTPDPVRYFHRLTRTIRHETKERPLPPDIRSLTASDEYTVDMRDREQLMEEQNLDDEENTEDGETPKPFKED